MKRIFNFVTIISFLTMSFAINLKSNKNTVLISSKTKGGEWQCGLHGDGAFRLNSNGDTECLGDGVNCHWGICAEGGEAVRNYAKTGKPLACGEHHKQHHGGTGYEDPNHWCNDVKNKINSQNEWQCGLHGDGAFRLNSHGDTECLGDGVNCHWGICAEGADAVKNYAKTGKPLTCGDHHKQHHGGTGYEDPNHWCNDVREQLGGGSNQWHCGIFEDGAFRLNKNGDAECLGDGINCHWTICKEGQQALVNYAKTGKPLTCGEHHKQHHGGTGYDTPNHWCNAAKRELQNELPKWKCGVYGEGAFRLNHNRDTECLGDGINCHWNICAEGEEALIEYAKTGLPLACGEQHKKHHGGTGYESPDHWCNVVRHELVKNEDKWLCGVVGDAAFRINKNGDPQCLGDGVECDWGICKQGEEAVSKLAESGKPLTCGQHHKEVHGGTGYESEEHWCSTIRGFLVMNP